MDKLEPKCFQMVDRKLYAQILDDSIRWKKLLALLGTPKNASDVPVKMFWDDATDTAYIYVGKTQYYAERGGFEACIDQIPMPEDD